MLWLDVCLLMIFDYAFGVNKKECLSEIFQTGLCIEEDKSEDAECFEYGIGNKIGKRLQNRAQQTGSQQENQNPHAVRLEFLKLNGGTRRQHAVDNPATVKREDGQHIEYKQYGVDADAVAGHAG